MNVLATIISRTPIWVFPLIVGVLWLASRSVRERAVHPRAMLVFPLVLLALSIGSSIGTSLDPPVAITAWLCSVAVGGVLGWSIAGHPRAIDAASGRVIIPGSIVPLLVCIAIVLWRYAFGYLYGRYPELAADWSYALALIVGAATLGGVMLGRVCRHGLWVWRAALDAGRG